MSFKKFLTSRLFLKNLVVAIAIFMLIVFITMWGLKIYTRHGEAFPLPDLKGMDATELKQAAKKYRIRYQVIDSVYVKDAKTGSVIDQIPVPGFYIKEDRTVFITINSNSPEQVSLPKLRDVSFRQATVLIENSGLIVGKIKHKPSEYVDLVLDVFVDSALVYEGDRYPRGTEIGLVVGRSSQSEKTLTPEVFGLNLDDAKSVISNSMLNIGVVIYDETIINSKDSADAVIYKQRPDPNIHSKTDLGNSIDLWLTIDKLKVIDSHN